VNQEQMVKYVVSELGKHKHPNDVIKALAETGSMDWNTAKRFVYTVKARYGKDIARQRAPLLLVIAVITMIAGAGLATGIGIATLKRFIIIFLAFPIPWLGNLVYFSTGLLAFFGGLLGVFKTIGKAI